MTKKKMWQHKQEQDFFDSILPKEGILVGPNQEPLEDIEYRELTNIEEEFIVNKIKKNDQVFFQ